jgi:hypothetical protein
LFAYSAPMFFDPVHVHTKPDYDTTHFSIKSALTLPYSSGNAIISGPLNRKKKGKLAMMRGKAWLCLLPEVGGKLAGGEATAQEGAEQQDGQQRVHQQQLGHFCVIFVCEEGRRIRVWKGWLTGWPEDSANENGISVWEWNGMAVGIDVLMSLVARKNGGKGRNYS